MYLCPYNRALFCFQTPFVPENKTAGGRTMPNNRGLFSGPRLWAGPAALFCWVPALVPGPSSACTRVLCMHKSVVHAQESCACTRILCMHKNIFCICTRDFLSRHNMPFYSYIIVINIALKHFHTRDEIFSFIYTCIVD